MTLTAQSPAAEWAAAEQEFLGNLVEYSPREFTELASHFQHNEQGSDILFSEIQRRALDIYPSFETPDFINLSTIANERGDMGELQNRLDLNMDFIVDEINAEINEKYPGYLDTMVENHNDTLRAFMNTLDDKPREQWDSNPDLSQNAN
mmetsp:Transcript_16732/g.14633  ORF Transcript_16732/g.14633 Transcript_16732/m.14633 type:complete len:149 (-) Transcript_16732:586-1032(-)